MTECFRYVQPAPIEFLDGMHPLTVNDLLTAYAHRKQGCGGVIIDYTNWRKKRSLRTIVPVPGSLRQVEEGEAVTAWHEPGTWIFRAFDLKHGEERHFAAHGVHTWTIINSHDKESTDAQSEVHHRDGR